ncbi:unnamed protein product [Hermetia illucens]|uniref:Uncharacterized protein n=1 Tax=Hermetia illucens TaxID=343691 RepID=A0A7R8YUJ5_HERIL|nr:unnamed protein product [Hermetia illucens]
MFACWVRIGKWCNGISDLTPEWYKQRKFSTFWNIQNHDTNNKVRYDSLITKSKHSQLISDFFIWLQL